MPLSWKKWICEYRLDEEETVDTTTFNQNVVIRLQRLADLMFEYPNQVLGIIVSFVSIVSMHIVFRTPFYSCASSWLLWYS